MLKGVPRAVVRYRRIWQVNISWCYFQYLPGIGGRANCCDVQQSLVHGALWGTGRCSEIEEAGDQGAVEQIHAIMTRDGDSVVTSTGGCLVFGHGSLVTHQTKIPSNQTSERVKKSLS